jgi:hypothetical protein
METTMDTLYSKPPSVRLFAAKTCGEKRSASVCETVSVGHAVGQTAGREGGFHPEELRDSSKLVQESAEPREIQG